MSKKSKRFETLVKAYSAELYRYGYWLCGDLRTAEDLVQETFTRAWRALDSLQNEQAARNWLYTILRREHARLHERIQPQLTSIDELEHNHTELYAPVSYDTNTEAFVLRRALDKLAAEYREPLLLQVLAGFSCEEIGAIMNIKPGAVMTRVSRARKTLKNWLTEPTDEQQRK